MFQRLKISEQIQPVLCTMLDQLGEPIQVLTPESPHPLVVHQMMGQITLVARGSGYVSLVGETFTLDPGDLLIMAPGCEHAFLCPSGELELRHWHWPQALLDTDRTVLADTFNFATTGFPEIEGGCAT